MNLIRVQLCADRSSCGNGSTNHAHITSLFIIQFSTFTGKELLLEQEICTGKVIVNAADEQRSTTRKHVNNITPFQAVLLKSRDRESYTQWIIAQVRTGRKVDHFVA